MYIMIYNPLYCKLYEKKRSKVVIERERALESTIVLVSLHTYCRSRKRANQCRGMWHLEKYKESRSLLGLFNTRACAMLIQYEYHSNRRHGQSMVVCNGGCTLQGTCTEKGRVAQRRAVSSNLLSQPV